MEAERAPAVSDDNLLTKDNGADGMVSVVVPCYNEERFILKALDQLSGQYDTGQYEIIVVDGLSSDGTRTLIERFQGQHPDIVVRLIDNPRRNIPTALNLGIAAAQGAIIARMDAHAVPGPGYIRRCVEVLKQTDAGVVGMPCNVQPGADTLMAHAIACAVSHPFGIGDARYRLGAAGPVQESVDTVAFACFRKSLWIALGGFNESLLTNEDYEFNYRVRRSGRDVILDRTSHCDYFARTTLGELAGQYFRYGSWKAEMVRLNPASTRARHLAAPAFVLSLGVLGPASLVWHSVWPVMLSEITVYALAGLIAAVQATVRRAVSRVAIPAILLAFVTIHITWGAGFLFRLFRIRSK